MSLGVYVMYFLLVNFLTALACALIRLRRPDQIIRETTRLFVSVTVGIAILCAVVYVIEWIFIRPLL